MNCEMAFLIVFPSFTPKKDAFLIGFKSFLIYSHTPSYLFCSFSYMMAAAFPGLSRTYDYSFPYVVY